MTVSSNVYHHGSTESYFRDLALVALGGTKQEEEACERLDQHSLDIARSDEANKLAQLGNPPNTHPMAVPPLWLLRKTGDYMHRPYIDAITLAPLPKATTRINIPKLVGKSMPHSGLAAVAHAYGGTQTPSKDLRWGHQFINATVRTTAGEAEITEDLVRSCCAASPTAFDEIIFRDLVADYATRTTRLAISGTGQHETLGVSNTPGIMRANTNFGDLRQVMTAIGHGIKHIDTRLPATHIIMHPARWETLARQLGTKNATLFALPVVTEPEMPTHTIHIARTNDILMWESGLRARARRLDQQPPTALIQLYAESAFSAGRYPSSIVEITPRYQVHFVSTLKGARR